MTPDGAFQLDRPQHLHEAFAVTGRQPASTSVNQKPIFIYQAEVAPGRHIVGTEFKIHPQGLQGAATDLVFQRIEAKDREVTGTTADRNARTSRDGHPQG